MTLEKLLLDLTAALQENTATLRALSGNTKAAAATPRKSDDKPADKPADKSADKSADKPGRGPGRPPKAKSASDMADAAKKFAESAEDREDEFQDRRTFLAEVAEKFGASKFSAISDAKDQAAALAMLEEWQPEDGGKGDADY